MANDPKDPSQNEDQTAGIEDGELSEEDLKKIAAGRSMNMIHNVGGIKANIPEAPSTRGGTLKKG